MITIYKNYKKLSFIQENLEHQKTKIAVNARYSNEKHDSIKEVYKLKASFKINFKKI